MVYELNRSIITSIFASTRLYYFPPQHDKSNNLSLEKKYAANPVPQQRGATPLDFSHACGCYISLGFGWRADNPGAGFVPSLPSFQGKIWFTSKDSIPFPATAHDLKDVLQHPARLKEYET
jgi:hypothetical protein